jgi:hypothetical protein
MASGFRNVILKLKTWAPAEFKDVLRHVAGFQTRSRMDQDEFIENLEAGVLVSSSTFSKLRSNEHEETGADEEEDGSNFDLNLDDPFQVLKVLVESYKDDLIGIGYIKTILQHLLIPTKLINTAERTKHLYLIDHIISQIVLDKNGLESDFAESYKIPVEEIVKGLMDVDIVEQMGVELERARTRCLELVSEKKRLERDFEERQGILLKPASKTDVQRYS